MPEDKIDLKEVTKAIADVQNAFAELKATDDERQKEMLTKGAVDTLLDEKLTKINDDIAEKQTQIDKLYTSQRRAHITLDGKDVDIEELNEKAQKWADARAYARGTKASEFGYDEQMAYKAAFKQYLRKDDRVLSADEQKALSVGSDPDGGYVVSPDTSGRMVKKIFETSDVRRYASTQVISTNVLEGLFDLDESSSGWVSETATRTETTTPQLKAWSIPVHELYAEPRATQKLLDDAEIDMESWLAEKVASQMARTENSAFVNGDGVGKPRGFLDYPTGTTNPGQLKRFLTGVDGDFAADPSGGDAMINMIYNLKAEYRNNANFFMNRTTMGGVRLLRDGDNNMLWQPSFVAGQPSQILGYGIASFEDMPDYTTTDALAIAFGDMRQAYQIVERQGTRVLRDPFTAKPYIKFYTTRRVGGDVINFEAINLLEFTA
jgi:HK97 family phage major capsid protein